MLAMTMTMMSSSVSMMAVMRMLLSLKRLCIFVVDVGGECCCVVCEIEGGARSDACRCRDGIAPIHLAARGGHVSTVELLISKNVDVNVQDK